MGSEPHKPIKNIYISTNLNCERKAAEVILMTTDRIKAVSDKPKIHTNPLPTKP